MDKYNQLSYCSVCKNKKTELKKGIYCGLTNTYPSFEKSCKDYSLDHKELELKKEKLRKNIESRYSKKSLFNKFLDKEIYSKNEKYYSKNLKIIEKEYAYNRFLYLIPAIALFIFLIYYCITHWLSITNENTTIFIIFICSLIIICLYQVFKTNRNSLKINHNAIYYNDIIISWNDIITYGHTQNNTDSRHYNKVILGTKSRGIIELELYQLDISTTKFLEIVNSQVTKLQK